MKQSKRPQVAGSRNPVAVAARVHRRQVVPDKRGKLRGQLARADLRSGQLSRAGRAVELAAATGLGEVA